MIYVRQIPSHYTSERLTIEDIQSEQTEALQTVYDTCRYLLEWEGKTEQYDTNMIKKLLREPDFPVNGHVENLRQQSIRLKTSEEVIGILEVYHGYPSDRVFWLSMLLVHKTYQGEGYGQEVVRALASEVKQLNIFTHMQCAVHLKNWPGIRFWYKSGFNKIVKYFGDTVYDNNKFAGMRLQYAL